MYLSFALLGQVRITGRNCRINLISDLGSGRDRSDLPVDFFQLPFIIGELMAEEIDTDAGKKGFFRAGRCPERLVSLEGQSVVMLARPLNELAS